MCSCSNPDGIYGLDDMAIDLEQMAGVGVGVVGSRAVLDKYVVEKVEFLKNNMTMANGLKVVGGAVLSASMAGNKFVEGVGMGIVADGAAALAKEFLPSIGTTGNRYPGVYRRQVPQQRRPRQVGQNGLNIKVS